MSEDKSKLQLIGEIAQANNKNLELIEELNDRENEIERLSKDNEYLNKVNIELSTEKNRLNNIIEEVREYLTDEGVCILNKGKKENERLVWTWENYYDLLEILKGSEKE